MSRVLKSGCFTGLSTVFTQHMHLQQKPELEYLASTQAYFDDRGHFEDIRCALQ